MSNEIIGIDSSVAGTGVAMLSSESIPCVFRIDTKPQGFKHPLLRYRYIANTVLQRCKSYFGTTTQIKWGMEGYSMASKYGRLTELAEVAGLIKQVMFTHTGEYPIIIAPNTLKKFVTGKGKGVDKAHMLLAAYKKWGMEFDTHDEGDAFSVAKLIEALYYKDPKDLFQYERECVATLRKSHTWVP